MRNLFALILMVTILSCSAQIRSRETPISWEAVATSMQIIEGRVNEVSKKCRRERACYLIANINVDELVKGERKGRRMDVAIYDDGRKLIPKEGHSYLFLLSEGSTDTLNETGYESVYLAEVPSEYSILEASDHLRESLKSIVRDHNKMVAIVNDKLDTISDAECSRIVNLTTKMKLDGNAQYFLDQLNEINNLDFVCLVREMDSFNLLNGQSVEVSVAGHKLFYRPRKISDAIAIALNRATIKSFGVLSSGDASDDYRRNVVNGWKILLYRQELIAD